MTRKQMANVYRRAARDLEQGNREFACTAIVRASNYKKVSDEQRAVDAFAAVFKECASCVWWPLTTEGRDARVLALCFMAAMVEAGDA